jgi:hypothetical protein
MTALSCIIENSVLIKKIKYAWIEKIPFERGNDNLRDEMFVDKRKNIIFLKPIP